MIQLDLDAEGLFTSEDILAAVRDALSAKDQSRADKLIAAWKAKERRSRDLAALKAAAATQGAKAAPPISDEALAAEVSALLGRKVSVKPAKPSN